MYVYKALFVLTVIYLWAKNRYHCSSVNYFILFILSGDEKNSGLWIEYGAEHSM